MHGLKESWEDPEACLLHKGVDDVSGDSLAEAQTCAVDEGLQNSDLRKHERSEPLRH